MMLSRKHHWYINACLCLDSVTSHREVRILLLLLDGLSVGLLGTKGTAKSTSALSAKIGGYELLLAEEST